MSISLRLNLLQLTLCAVIAISASSLSAQDVSYALADYSTLTGETTALVANDNTSVLIGVQAARIKHPTITGAGYTVAVIDTGVDMSHPALAGRYVAGYDFADSDANPDDDSGHGTHVAGIIASNDPVYGGIAPEVGIAPVRVLGADGSGGQTEIKQGLQWVIDNREAYNIVAVNMSLVIGPGLKYNVNVTGSISDELATLKDAGVFIATAVGNDWFAHSPDPPGIRNEGIAYPAADANTVAVGSVWSKDFERSVTWSTGAVDNSTGPDRMISHSNRSRWLMDVVAPGGLISSCAYNWEGANSDFITKSGTSMATPAVAGLAVLIREAIEENWDPADWPVGGEWQDTILDIMQTQSVTIFDGDDEDDNVVSLYYSFARIDAEMVLDYTVPEPATLSLLAAGAVALVMRRKRNTRA